LGNNILITTRRKTAKCCKCSLKNTAYIDIMKRARKNCTSMAFLGLSGN
jgi:hypothetical protein